MMFFFANLSNAEDTCLNKSDTIALSVVNLNFLINVRVDCVGNDCANALIHLPEYALVLIYDLPSLKKFSFL
jgi:hypothetical protein